MARPCAELNVLAVAQYGQTPPTRPKFAHNAETSGLMNTNPPDDQPTVIDVAVQFIASQPGRVERLLELHHRLPDGLCSGCLAQVTKWPCSVANLALLAGREGWPDSGKVR